jgi:hypothetical protein
MSERPPKKYSLGAVFAGIVVMSLLAFFTMFLFAVAAWVAMAAQAAIAALLYFAFRHVSRGFAQGALIGGAFTLLLFTACWGFLSSIG